MQAVMTKVIIADRISIYLPKIAHYWIKKVKQRINIFNRIHPMVHRLLISCK